jgi:hypothetical protein
MLYAAAAMERAMNVQEVICRVLAGTLSWLRAADILASICADGVRGWGDGLIVGERTAVSRGLEVSSGAAVAEAVRIGGDEAKTYPKLALNLNYQMRRDYAIGCQR